MLPLTTAFFTAALALTGIMFLSQWNRYRDRRGIAAALAGELGAYIKLFDAPKTIPRSRGLSNVE